VSNPPLSPAPAKPDKPRQPERRTAPRYTLAQRCLVRPEGATGPGDWNGMVYNLSASGVGLALPFRAAAGMLLLIEPWGLPGARPLLARVVRSATVEFAWFHGCELAEPLGDDELRAWLPPVVRGST
jgi:PilZ domain